MDNIIIIYVIAQLLTTAFGIAVIESVRPLVEKKLHDKGYIQKRNNSLYEFNDKIVNVLLGFIPFYYFIKALSIINNKDIVDTKVEEEIRKGNYILYSDKVAQDEEILNSAYDPKLSVAKKPELLFEKPEKYTARRNDLSLYDTYETPVEYITREVENENDLEITTFSDVSKETVEVHDDNKVSKSDIAKAITELDVNELELLKNKISTLADIKKEELSLKLKDAA